MYSMCYLQPSENWFEIKDITFKNLYCIQKESWYKCMESIWLTQFLNFWKSLSLVILHQNTSRFLGGFKSSNLQFQKAAFWKASFLPLSTIQSKKLFLNLKKIHLSVRVPSVRLSVRNTSSVLYIFLYNRCHN